MPCASPSRKAAEGEGIGCGEQPAIHGVTTFSIEDFTGLQVTFGGGHGIGAKPGRASRRLRGPTEATEMPASSPIRCQYLYRQPYLHEESVRTAYSMKGDVGGNLA